MIFFRDARMKGTAEDELSVTLKTDTEKLKKARQLAAKRNRVKWKIFIFREKEIYLF